MTLQYLDTLGLGAIIVDAWQNHLETEKDPAGGQWFANGPGNNGGLFGKLTDTLASELVFDVPAQTFSVYQSAAATGIVDNRNGLTPEQTVGLSCTFQDTVTTTHSVSKAVKTGTTVSIKGTIDAKVVKKEFGISFTAEYSHSWTDATAVSKSESRSFSVSVPVRNVPAGRVWQVVLMANKKELSMPYRADIVLKGSTVANFLSPIRGQKIWQADAGTLCEWINRHGSAGDESWSYGRDPADPTQGRISLLGTLKAVHTVNFTVRTLDVTESFRPDGDGGLVLATNAGSEAPVVDEVLVTELAAA
ncbi:ETX/MTX2 family pore-forming toxin [Paracoccus sp. pheM1]|uniref:ETX/MTX2 family pore-forming toxin n=1 Tax=Paracoccus sp. pheM1 TaxID=2831675 RepID=UPI001BDB729D|nr:ETX/MTX2 family pore-forming toxin [Paracoccus sp. pheM1]MBT0778748.1 ETX/MTX2 family pore-forming toxin [Paracoccus sp. pheM1]